MKRLPASSEVQQNVILPLTAIDSARVAACYHSGLRTHDEVFRLALKNVPFNCVIEERSAEEFATILDDPQTIALGENAQDDPGKLEGFIIARKIEPKEGERTPVADAISRAVGSMEYRSSIRDSGIPADIQRAYDNGHLYYIDELSSQGNPAVLARLLQDASSHPSIPDNALLLAKIFDGLSIRMPNEMRIDNFRGGNQRAQLLAEKFGLHHIGDAQELIQNFTVSAETMHDEFPTEIFDDDTCLPTSASFKVFFGSPKALAHYWERLSALRKNQQPTRRNIIRIAAITSATGMLSWLLLRNRSPEKIERNSIRIQNGQIDSLTLFDHTWNRKATSLEDNTALIPLFDLMSGEEKVGELSGFLVQGNVGITMTQGDAALVLAYHKNDNGDGNPQAGWLQFSGDNSTAQLLPATDVAITLNANGSWNQRRCNMKSIQSMSLTSYLHRLSATDCVANTTWNGSRAAQNQGLSVLRIVQQLSETSVSRQQHIDAKDLDSFLSSIESTASTPACVIVHCAENNIPTFTQIDALRTLVQEKKIRWCVIRNFPETP